MEQTSGFPGKRLAVVGLVLALTMSVAGLVVSVIALIMSARHNHSNSTAVAGIVIGVIGSAVFGFALFFLIQFFSTIPDPCIELGPGTHQNGLITYECEPV